MMRFVHMSDNHLGFRQYGLYEREKDFYSAFDECIEKIIKERPDFILHTGDLFEFSRPPIKALLKVQEAFLKLKEKNITIYGIAGNHDSIMRKLSNTPQELFKDFNFKLIDYNKRYYIHNDFFIGGSPFYSRYYKEVLMETINYLKSKVKKYDKKIILLHQAIDKYLPFENEITMSELPKNFNYYALGHIHKRILEDFGEGKLAYAGSTEMWSIDEYKNYQQKGKGFYLVDLESDLPKVQEVNLDLPRTILKEEILNENIDSEIEVLIKKIANYKVKPIVYLKVSGTKFKVNMIHQKLLNSLSKYVLTLRPNYDIKENEQQIKISINNLDIKKLINELKTKNPQLKKLALELYDLLSRNDLESAKEVTERAYKGAL